MVLEMVTVDVKVEMTISHHKLGSPAHQGDYKLSVQLRLLGSVALRSATLAAGHQYLDAMGTAGIALGA